MVSILEYSLHFATVLSRWAREYTNEVGALEVLQKIYSPKKALILFSEGTRPVGEGTGRKNAHHLPKKCTSSRCPQSATKNIFPPQNPYTNPLEIT